MTYPHSRPARPAFLLTAALLSATATADDGGYRKYAEQVAALKAAATQAGPAAKLIKLSDTAQKREVWALALAAPAATEPDHRPAILIVGGIDADSPTGTEAAFRVAAKLIDSLTKEPDGPAARSLACRTVYIVPCVDPDGYDAMFETPAQERRANGRPLDEDRDGRTDEDGPNDLNADGRISVMRVRDPAGEWIADPDEPRLMKKADRAKGQKGEFKLLVEGIDDDGDGQINEDGPGGVDCDRNWPHLFEAGTAECGLHPLSEPQTRALADFVLAHRNIVLACVYGRNDNIVQVAKAGDKQPDGKPYRDMHPDDKPLFDTLSEKFKKTSRLGSSFGGKPEGAFYSWLYAQQGVFTLAITPWITPEPPASQPASGPASAPAGDGPGGAKKPDDAGPSPGGGPSSPGPGGGPPGRGARGGRGRGAGMFPGGPPGGAPSSEAAAKDTAARETGVAATVECSDSNKKWLGYNDRTPDKKGFIAWTAVDHPEFGKVEIGGFAPYFKTAAPAADLTAIADQQFAALLELSDLLPAPAFLPAVVKDHGAGVWEVRLRLTNAGFLPTHSAMALHAQQPGWVIRPQLPSERIIGGRRMERVENIPGSGGLAEVRWLIRGAPDEKVAFTAYNRVHGELPTEVVLKMTPPTTEVRP
ncbi:Zinc carboxypeptidase [Phycisphaerae bacterium RAS1]|nr:Zinc carboxypeptidase [Phycisphaerae bacterium RAS1]